MTQPDLISVLVTVRNGEAFLCEALDSLLAQQTDGFEVIVVNDGSTDETEQRLAQYKEDKRVTIIHLPPSGRVRALQRAVDQASGEYLAILDSDDVALPERLQVQRTYLKQHREIALCGTRAMVFEGNKEWIAPSPSGCDQVRRALAMYNPFFFSSVMVRRTAYDRVGGFRLEDGWCYDVAFLQRIARHYPVDILPQVFIRYRRHLQQISSSDFWERVIRPQSAARQLRAAWDLGLPWHMWIFPLLGWMYAMIPVEFRPVSWKQPLKQVLLNFFLLTAPKK